MKTLSPPITTHVQRRTLNSARPLRYSVLTVICGSVMILGFFFAARQHFSSIEYGIKNSRLRKQLDELEAEKRRLLLAKEVSMSPIELMKAARKIGFTQNGAASIAGPMIVKTAAGGMRSPVIQKTVLSKPAIAIDENSRAEKIDRPVKKDGTLKDKKS